jgi:hypothetical protein
MIMICEGSRSRDGVDVLFGVLSGSEVGWAGRAGQEVGGAGGGEGEGGGV